MLLTRHLVLFLCLACLGACAPRALDDAETLALFNGSSVTGLSYDDGPFQRVYSPDGSLTQAANRVQKSARTGRWSVRGGELCIQWRYGLPARECRSVFTNDRGVYMNRIRTGAGDDYATTGIYLSVVDRDGNDKRQRLHGLVWAWTRLTDSVGVALGLTLLAAPFLVAGWWLRRRRHGPMDWGMWWAAQRATRIGDNSVGPRQLRRMEQRELEALVVTAAEEGHADGLRRCHDELVRRGHGERTWPLIEHLDDHVLTQALSAMSFRFWDDVDLDRRLSIKLGSGLTS